MVITFGLGSGSCVVFSLCSNVYISGRDYYSHRAVFGSLKVYFIDGFCIGCILLVYFIHRIMGHRACSVVATPGV